MIVGAGIFVFTYGPIMYSEISYRLADHGQTVIVGSVSGDVVAQPLPSEDDSLGIDKIKAVDDNFSVVIPSIEVNAPVVADVTMVNEAEYMNALEEGVAHAVGTPYPGENGNMFLFAHSSLNFWQLGPYATVFNLLNKLKDGDLVYVVKDSKTYIYKVKKTEVVKGWDTTPFDREYEEPMLTMVTCYPPGTTLSRYVVTSTYIGME
jgi:sortase A